MKKSAKVKKETPQHPNGADTMQGTRVDTKLRYVELENGTGMYLTHDSASVPRAGSAKGHYIMREDFDEPLFDPDETA